MKNIFEKSTMTFRRSTSTRQYLDPKSSNSKEIYSWHRFESLRRVLNQTVKS